MTIWANDAWAAEPFLPTPTDVAAAARGAGAFDPRRGGSLVWLVDLEAALGGGTVPTAGPAWADNAWGAEPPAFTPAGGTETLRFSDMGWRSAPTDFGGVVSYPPLLSNGPNIERRVSLAPGASDNYAWGTLGLASPGQIPNASLAGRDTAMRKVRIRAGVRGWDATRGIPTDAPASSFIDVFTGMVLTWRSRDGGAEVPLRDPTAWLNAPIGTRRFLGTGGVEGPSDLAGTFHPIVRGGSSGSPVRSIPVTLVNTANRIYRWSDVGTLSQVYEDGVAVYTNAGVVADVFSSSPSPGTFVSDATGQFRLGSDPQGTVTVDGYSGAIIVATILRNLLVDTVGLPGGMLDEGSVFAAASAVPYVGGWAWTGQETANDAIAPLLAAMGARLVSSRSGGLRLWPLRALTASTRPVLALDQYSAVSVVPVPLDAPMVPPAATWAVGYSKTHTTTTSPKPTVSLGERERLAKPWRTATWADPNNLIRFAQASRPDLVETALLQEIEAVGLADALGALWGTSRSLWQVTVPTGTALLQEIGDVVSIGWPVDGLRSGALGQIVGESIRAGDSTASILILV